jgi:hypothetical protein
MMPAMRRLYLVTVIAVALAGCSSPGDSPAGAERAPTAAAAAGRPTVTGQAPPGSVVTLEPAGATPAAPPPGPAILDQYSRNFVPDLLLVRVGQRVEFRNSEDIDHNVSVVRTPTGTRVFDTSTPPFQKYDHTFERAGRYDVSCDIHPGMRATIVATTAPHGLVVDASGAFSFPELQPGRYVLTVATSARSTERQVEVGTTALDLGTIVP